MPRTEERWYNKAAYFNHNNRNKYSTILDLQTNRGRELFLKLVSISDVLVENYRADVMQKLQLGYEEIKSVNPKIV